MTGELRVPTVAEAVADEVGVPAADVRGDLRVQMPERSTNITIEMTADDARTAAEVARSVSQRVVERADSDDYLSAEVVVPADADRAVSRSGRTRLLVVVTIASAALATATVMVLQLISVWRTRRRAGASGNG